MFPRTSRRSCRMEKPLWSMARSLAKTPVERPSRAASNRNLIRRFTVTYETLRFYFCLAQHLLHSCCHSTLVIRKGNVPSRPPQIIGRITHDKWMSCKGKHLDVVVIVSNSHDLFARNAAILGPTLNSMPLRASLVENIDDREIAQRIFSPQTRDFILQAASREGSNRLVHPANSAAKHGLHGIAHDRFLNRNHEVDVAQVLLQPALNAGAELVHVLENNRPLAFCIESQNGVATELHHCGA